MLHGGFSDNTKRNAIHYHKNEWVSRSKFLSSIQHKIVLFQTQLSWVRHLVCMCILLLFNQKVKQGFHIRFACNLTHRSKSTEFSETNANTCPWSSSMKFEVCWLHPAFFMFYFFCLCNVAFRFDSHKETVISFSALFSSTPYLNVFLKYVN